MGYSIWEEWEGVWFGGGGAKCGKKAEKSELGGWVRYLGVFFFFFLAGKRRCGGV